MFRYTRSTLVREVITIVVVVILLLPFYVLITTSLKTSSDVLTSSSLAVPHPTLQAFATILGNTGQANGNIVFGLLMSVFITVGTVILLVAFGSMTGYVLARRTTRWSRVAYYAFMIGITVPTQLGVVPLYAGARSLGLVGSPVGMIVIYTGLLLPLSVFFYAGFFRGLPRDYEEAATIDGAGRWQVFLRVVFPLMSPVTGSVAIVAGLFVWNDFFTALIFLNGSGYATLPLVVYNYVGSVSTQWNLVFAVVIISMIPVLAFYLFAQRRFIQGFSGGLKS